MTSHLVVEQSIDMNATPEQVWEALTTPALTEQYFFNCRVESNWKQGDTITYTMDMRGEEVTVVKGTVLHIDPGTHIEYTVFAPGLNLPDVPENYTHVTYDISEQNGVTTLRVTQGDFALVENGAERFSETGPMWEATLEGLKTLVEQG